MPNQIYRDILTKQELELLYWDQKMSTSKIGEIKGCNSARVIYWMRKWGIEIRTPDEGTLLYYHQHPRISGELHQWWKGGRSKNGMGYIKIRLYPDNFFYPMTSQQGYILEHRLIVAKRLGRCLQSWEIVHHLNGIRDDNREDNLQLLPTELEHTPSKAMQCRLKKLEEKVGEQSQQIRLLKWQINELKEVCRKSL